MTHRGWLLGVFVLLVSASFAGCLADEDAPDTTDTNAQGDGGDDGNATVDGAGGDTSDTSDPGNTGSTSVPVPVITVVGNTTVAPEEDVLFDASSTSDNDTLLDNLTFSWDFGDGSTAEGANATHAFAAEGNFTVVLNVTDPEGNSATTNTTIVVVNAFADQVVAELTGGITAPNPIVHNAGPAYGTMAAACGTHLECYTTFGGVEGTHFVIHTVEIPAGAAAVILEAPDISDTATLQFAVFDADGGRIGSAPVSPGNTAQKTSLLQPDRWVGGITVFVSSPGAPSSAYSITVTALAEAPA